MQKLTRAKVNGILFWSTALLVFTLAVAACLFGVAGPPGLPIANGPKYVLAAQAAGGHSVSLKWTASTSAAACSSTGTPPCTFGYNVFRGVATGAEGSIPLNASLITGTTYTDPITLTSSPQVFFYTIQAVETVNGVTATSTPSNEASATFPGQPAPATGTTATPQ